MVVKAEIVTTTTVVALAGRAAENNTTVGSKLVYRAGLKRMEWARQGMRSWEGVRGGEDAGEMSQHGCTIIANRYNSIRCIVL